MDILAPLIRHIFYPLWMIREGDKGILKYLKYFEFIDNLNQSDLEKRQEKKLKDLLIHAYENTSYYKRQFDESGFNPHDMRNKEEILKIPILTKDIVRNHYSELAAKNIEKEQVAEASTGGSTGVPMIFLRDKESIYLRKGQELYFDRWMGHKIGEKIALFVAASHFDGTVNRLKGRIKNATFERMLRFDPHHITDEYMEDFVHQYVRFEPSMIKCFPNSLTAFAEFINRKGVELPPVRSISCTGESVRFLGTR